MRLFPRVLAHQARLTYLRAAVYIVYSYRKSGGDGGGDKSRRRNNSAPSNISVRIETPINSHTYTRSDRTMSFLRCCEITELRNISKQSRLGSLECIFQPLNRGSRKISSNFRDARTRRALYNFPYSDILLIITFYFN